MVYWISNYPSPSELKRRVLAVRSDGSYAQGKLGKTFSGVTDMSMIQVKLDDNTLEYPSHRDILLRGMKCFIAGLVQKD